MVTIRSKPKHYGPLVVRGAGVASLVITTPTGATVRTGTSADEQTMPPGDLLMAALASCLTISLQMAASTEGIDTGEVTLSIEAFIDGGEPRRFDRFAVRVAMPSIADPAIAAKLLARAEQLCTVSHTLDADITLELAH